MEVISTSRVRSAASTGFTTSCRIAISMRSSTQWDARHTGHKCSQLLSLSLSPVSAHVWFFAAHADQYRRAMSRFDSSSTRLSRKEGCVRALRAPPLPLAPHLHATWSALGPNTTSVTCGAAQRRLALTMKESRERETMDHPRGGPAALTHTRTLCSLSIYPARSH
jgi:hypothetical protein